MSTSAKANKSARSNDTEASGHGSPGDRGASLEARPSGIDFVDRALAAPGQGLPAALRKGIESLSGLSLDHVRVHHDSPRPAELGTLAYAQGSDIHLAPGQEHALPHEAWHVVQQAQGRVAPTARATQGQAVNDQLQLEHEADAMGHKALSAFGVAAPHGERAAPQGGLSAAPLQSTGATGTGAVIQCWPGFIDRWLQKRKGFAPVEDPDRDLAESSKVVGHQAQTAQSTVEARRRDKALEGVVQIGEEGAKMGLDALGAATVGVPFGSVVGGIRSAQKIASSGHQAYRETGRSDSVVGAVGKEVLKEGVGQALGNIPVVGEFIGMAEGVATIGYAVFQSEDSRMEDKQTALDKLLANEQLMEEARERLADPGLEAVSRRRLAKALQRYDKALAAGRKWQQGKMNKGTAPLLMPEIQERDH